MSEKPPIIMKMEQRRVEAKRLANTIPLTPPAIDANAPRMGWLSRFAKIQMGVGSRSARVRAV